MAAPASGASPSQAPDSTDPTEPTEAAPKDGDGGSPPAEPGGEPPPAPGGDAPPPPADEPHQKGDKPPTDPEGPGYGTTPEENPQMTKVDGYEHIYESPSGQRYEYNPHSEAKWDFSQP